MTSPTPTTSEERFEAERNKLIDLWRNRLLQPGGYVGKGDSVWVEVGIEYAVAHYLPQIERLQKQLHEATKTAHSSMNLVMANVKSVDVAELERLKEEREKIAHDYHKIAAAYDRVLMVKNQLEAELTSLKQAIERKDQAIELLYLEAINHDISEKEFLGLTKVKEAALSGTEAKEGE